LKEKFAMNFAPTRMEAGTVSETVSESTERVVKNSGELARITLDFPSNLTIFPLLNRRLQVAARPDPPACQICCDLLKNRK
jgi:hypothetical protein